MLTYLSHNTYIVHSTRIPSAYVESILIAGCMSFKTWGGSSHTHMQWLKINLSTDQRRLPQTEEPSSINEPTKCLLGIDIFWNVLKMIMYLNLVKFGEHVDRDYYCCFQFDSFLLHREWFRFKCCCQVPNIMKCEVFKPHFYWEGILSGNWHSSTCFEVKAMSCENFQKILLNGRQRNWMGKKEIRRKRW